METGKVIKWLKKEGDAVKGGDVIAEIETDKANVEIEAFGSGVLRKIVVGQGGTVPVGEMIGVIADPAEDMSASPPRPRSRLPRRPRPPPRRPRPGSAPAPAPPAPPPAAAARDGDATSRHPPRPRSCRWRRAPAAAGAGRAGERVKASPLARKIAAQSGVDLRLIQGTRPGRPHRAARRRGGSRRRGRRPRPRRAAAPRPPRSPRGPRSSIPPRTEAEFEDVALSPDARHHRQAHAAVEGAGPALLRHLGGGDGRAVGAARAS